VSGDEPKRPRRSLHGLLFVIAAGITLPAGIGAGWFLHTILIAGADMPAVSKLAGATAVLAAAAGLAALFHLWRRIHLAFCRLGQSIQEFMTGQGSARFELNGDDEFSDLAGRLGAMAAGAQAFHTAAQQQQISLESVLEARAVELQQKNLALAYQNEKVLEANRLKSAFLANVSHELRTPLNAILALSDMLRDQITGPLNEEQLRQIEMIYNSGDNLLHLINEVLDLSKIESGRMDDNRAPVQIIDHLLESAESLRPLAVEKGLHLQLEPEGAGEQVSLDADKIRQVFINILGNAIKFTEKGTVTARMRVLPEEDLLYVEVQDTGSGIPAHLHNSIFEEFRRLEHPQGEHLEGSGLGLAISKKLINLMGGDLWVDSAVGAGSRFAFVVPLRSNQEAPGSEDEPPLRIRFNGRARTLADPERKCVLVVDDDVVESGVLTRYLRKENMEILTAHDMQEALSVLRRETVDLVLMDLLSRGDEGFRLIEQVTRDPQLRQLPILVNTARKFNDGEEGFLAGHVGGVFEKGSRGVEDLMRLVVQTVQTVESVPGVGEDRGPTPAGPLSDGFEAA
jgi:signal transduction histidine kinase/CheY-like chemotaxis protein